MIKNKQTNKQTKIKTKRKQTNKPKTTINANQRHKQLWQFMQNKVDLTNCEMKISGATLHK